MPRNSAKRFTRANIAETF